MTPWTVAWAIGSAVLIGAGATGIAIQAFAGTSKPETYGPFDTAVRIDERGLHAFEAVGGDGPGGWGETIFSVEGTVHVEFYKDGQLRTWPADFDSNGDGVVDLEDFAAFQAAFMGDG